MTPVQTLASTEEAVPTVRARPRRQAPVQAARSVSRAPSFFDLFR
jgi:hypothetical protein